MDNRISSLVLYLQNNLESQISIEEMARTVSLSPSRLQHVFKSETGLPISKYVRQLRLEKAAELLITSHLSVKEIRTLVGMRDARHFTADFKSRFGMTPTAYRKKFFNPEAVKLFLENKTAESTNK
jgi:AraC family transcriptional regulator, arabinose operon regulatory protein